MNHYLSDVLNQPQSLKTALGFFENLSDLKQIAAWNFKKVIFTGMGSSHYCNFGASQYLNQKGFVSMVKSAGNFFHYEKSLIDQDTLLVLVSQSGESAEIVNIVKALPADCKVVAITNDENSTLGKRGDVTLLMHVDEEESVTTRTYLASIVLVDLLAKSIAGENIQNFFKEVATSIDTLDCYLKRYEEESKRISEFFQSPAYLCLIGRGASMSSVCAGALFLREIVKYPAIDFDAGEFRHGPMEMVEDGFCGVMLSTDQKTHLLNFNMAVDIADRGGKVMFITNSPQTEEHKNILQISIGNVDEFTSPLVSIAPIQLLANGLAEQKNIDVGKFRWGSKVTRAE